MTLLVPPLSALVSNRFIITYRSKPVNSENATTEDTGLGPRLEEAGGECRRRVGWGLVDQSRAKRHQVNPDPIHLSEIFAPNGHPAGICFVLPSPFKRVRMNAIVFSILNLDPMHIFYFMDHNLHAVIGCAWSSAKSHWTLKTLSSLYTTYIRRKTWPMAIVIANLVKQKRRRQFSRKHVRFNHSSISSAGDWTMLQLSFLFSDPKCRS